MTTTVRITLGLTGWDDPTYRPTMDGYRPGAPQDRYVLDVPADLVRGLPAESIAEEVYAGQNEPQMFAPETTTLRGWVAREVLPLRSLAHGGTMRSLSVGDTIEMGDLRLECQSFGWDAVYGGAAR